MRILHVTLDDTRTDNGRNVKIGLEFWKQNSQFLTATPGQNHSALTLDTPSGYGPLAMMSSLYSLPQKFVVLRLCWLSNLSGTNHLNSIGTMFARHLSHTENGYIIQKNTMKNNVLACKLPTLFNYATSAVIWNDDCDMLCNLSIHYLQRKKNMKLFIVICFDLNHNWQ